MTFKEMCKMVVDVVISFIDWLTKESKDKASTVTPTAKKSKDKANTVTQTTKESKDKASTVTPTAKKSKDKANTVTQTTKKSKDKLVPERVFEPTNERQPQKPVPLPEPQTFIQHYQYHDMVSKMIVTSSYRIDASEQEKMNDCWNVTYSFSRDIKGHDTVIESWSKQEINRKNGLVETFTSVYTYEDEQDSMFELKPIPLPKPSKITQNYTLTSRLSAYSFNPIDWGSQDEFTENWVYSLSYERDIKGHEVLTERFYQNSVDFNVGTVTMLDSISIFEDKVDPPKYDCFPGGTGGYIGYPRTPQVK